MLQHHNHAMSSYLCEDLIDEIFVRLPVKSLVQYKSLSKSWSSRIFTPSFIRKHTLRSATVQLPSKTYFLRQHVLYNFNGDRCQQCYLLDNGYTGLKSDTPLRYYFGIVGSCNGITCLFTKDERPLTLWNPSIRRKLTVPALPSSNKRVLFGFGFDPISDDYKIVAIYKTAQSSFIYSLKTNSWSKILSATPNCYRAPSFFDSASPSACFFNRTLHWVVRCTLNDIQESCIMTFDLSTNVFGFISLPKPDFLHGAPLMTIKGCLDVQFQSRDDDNNRSILVMRQNSNVAYRTMAYDMFYGILMNRDHTDSILYNHETQTCSRFLYDHETQTYSRFGFSSSLKVEIDMCVGSLELIDKEIVTDESYFLDRSEFVPCYLWGL